jgi:hypothetical protein
MLCCILVHQAVGQLVHVCLTNHRHRNYQGHKAIQAPGCIAESRICGYTLLVWEMHQVERRDDAGAPQCLCCAVLTAALCSYTSCTCCAVVRTTLSQHTDTCQAATLCFVR